MNAAFLFLFLGVSIRNYKTNQAVFGSERLGKLYLALLFSSLVGLLLFGNRHIKSLYLDLNGKDVVVQTHTFFSLLEGRERVIPVRNLKGNRVFWSPKLNVYQLEYIKQGKWEKRRSLFYRPEYIGD